MIVAIFANPQKNHMGDAISSLIQQLTARGVTPALNTPYAERYRVAPIDQFPPQDIAFMISLGGDGTILRLVHAFPNISAPIVGINMGSLGFLADTKQENIAQAINWLLDNQFTVEKRFMIDVETAGKECFFAVNDLVVHRAQNPSLIELSITVDGQYVNTFSADGIIISTPSGSTAYSLSAGGPILTPNIEALVVTPINPHTISNRPIVVIPKQEIVIQYQSPYDPVDVIADGITKVQLATSKTVVVKPSLRRFCLVLFPNHDYFATLRTKLGWGWTGIDRNKTCFHKNKI